MLVKQVTDQLSLALENARLFQETQRREQEANLLNQIVIATTRSLDITEGLQFVAEEIAKLVSALHVGIALENEDQTSLILTADAPISSTGESNIGLSIPVIGNPTAELVVKTGKPLFINNTSNNPLTAAIKGILELRGTQSLFIWPVFAGKDVVIGSLGVDFAEPDRQLTSNESNLINSILLQISTYLQNARLFQETNQRNKELATLNDVIGSASQSLDLKTIFQIVLTKTLETIGFDGGLITMFNPARGKLERIVRIGLPGEIPPDPAEGMENSLCAVVYSTRDALAINDFRQGAPVDVSGEIKDGYFSYVGAPLQSKGQVLGTICGFRKSAGTIGQATIDLMRTIGRQIGFAIENARLFEATRESQEAATHSASELRALFAAMTDVIIVLDKEGRYLRIAPTNPSRLDQAGR